MSIEVLNTTITSPKKVIERTWRATQFTEFQSVDPAAIDLSRYRSVVHRERVTVIDGVEPGVSRAAVPPFVGPPADGTDGTDLSHYVDARPGFIPEVETDMAAVMAYADDETVTAGGVTVPAKLVPLLLQATYDLVSSKHQQAALAAAIEKVVAHAAASAE